MLLLQSNQERFLRTFLFLLGFLSVSWSNPLSGSTVFGKDHPILLIDVDNTLYSEEKCTIEAQIRDGIYRYCETLGISSTQADSWHHEYGSTVEGLRKHIPDPSKVMKDFYHQVYADIDLSSLIPNVHVDTTGYSHAEASNHVRLRDLLKSIPYPMYLASNSPTRHVRSILRTLGLNHIPWAGILTPDTMVDYPTKASQPNIYFQRVIESYPALQCILLDDSKTNLQNALSSLDMRGIYISSQTPILLGLAIALGHVDEKYTFSQIDYLLSKNVVDASSIHGPTWDMMRQQITTMAVTNNGAFTIADIGAGLLSMLQLLLVGDHNKKSIMADGIIHTLHYYAYESNMALYSGCKERLQRLGFDTSLEGIPTPGDQVIFSNDSLNITIHLCMCDFTDIPTIEQEAPPQLIVGCCFADLMEPYQLVQNLQRFLRKWNGESKETLLYFPITFAGTTQFFPPRPFAKPRIPSDTLALRLYSDALSHDHGHNLDPSKLVTAVQAHGGEVIHQGASPWNIDPDEHAYLWDTMLYFFGTVGAPELMKRDWDSAGWIQQTKTFKPKIVVSNVDLLFSLPSAKGISDTYEENVRVTKDLDTLTIQEIQFTGPYQVGTTTKLIDTKDGTHLGPNQVEIQAIRSLISSGTELKIFKGLFDDAALDVTINGMVNERMAFPLAYGYSLVGRVTRCGTKVADSHDLIGRLVFTFSPHSSHVICDRDSIQVVPEGIPAEEAIFMPSVETALSLVHDAHVRVGERVAIYGQGLIGLLVTAILCRTELGETLSVFDTLPARLAAASSMGASEALLPQSAAMAGPFDVSIEISGNDRALQSAIDYTRNGGRIIVGSWYGNRDVMLKLGIDFHRSHKTITTSQVSAIPAELTELWSKDRRFALSWELVKMLRPSRLITHTTTLSHAQEVYESLDQGRQIAVAFAYDTQ